MALFVNLCELMHVNVAINSRGGYVGMAEQFFYEEKVTIVFEQVSCEAMPEQMRVNTLIEAS